MGTTKAGALVALLLLAAPGALASSLPGAGVEADVHGPGRRCPVDAVGPRCFHRWETQDTLEPGDDRVEATLLVDRFRVLVQPSRDAEPRELDLWLQDVRVQHPVTRLVRPPVEASWRYLDASRPDAVKPLVAFEVGPHRTQMEGRPLEDKDAVFLALHPPLPVGSVGSVRVMWCWAVCGAYLPYGRTTEDEVRPFPDGLALRSWRGDNIETDKTVQTDLDALGSCPEQKPACERAPLAPPLRAAGEAYRASTPSVSFGFQLNHTSISVQPTAEERSRGAAAYAPPAPPRLLPEPLRPRRDVATEPGAPSGVPDPGAVGVPGPRPLPRPDPAGDALGVTPATSRASALPGALPLALLVGGAAASVLALLAWLLYSRISHKDMLSQETRRRAYEAIQAADGIIMADIARAVGREHNTVKYHVTRLLKGGLVVDDGGRYYAAAQPRRAPAPPDPLAEPAARALHETLLERDAWDKPSLAQRLQKSVATLMRLVVRLEEVGLARRDREGRRVLIRGIPPEEARDA